MTSMSSTTTGQNISEKVIKLMWNFQLNCGLASDGNPSITGKTNGFTKRFPDVLCCPEVLTNHCIIHVENLCSKVLGFAEFIKYLVKCVNYIRSRGLNHRLFKAFLLETDADSPDDVYFSAVSWLIRVATLQRFWNLRDEMKTFMKSKQQDVAYLKDVYPNK